MPVTPEELTQDSPEGDLNPHLLANWDRVFPLIPGFESCLCLRRVRCPDRNRDIDFFLLNQGKPALGLVECEGRKNKVPKGIEQLLTYVGWFMPYEGDGQRIVDVSIRDALESKKLRAKHNAQFGSIESWISHPRSQLQNEADLVDAVAKASCHIVPILLYYREDQLTQDEERILRLAFRKHRLYAGTIDPRSWSLIGGFL